MRKKIVAANWKMNLDVRRAQALSKSLRDSLVDLKGTCAIDVVVCPAYVHIPIVAATLENSVIQCGAQDVYFADNGAYTGQISAAMLNDIGCHFVFLGHSERRHIFGETDETVNKKLQTATSNGLQVIFCIGELLEERQNDKTELVIERQLRKGLANISNDQLSTITIGYEPVWAIGTGMTATAQQAQDVHAFIRKILSDMFGQDTANLTRIAYGGSVNSKVTPDIAIQKDVDGVLVGSASLNSENFIEVVRTVNQIAYNSGGNL